MQYNPFASTYFATSGTYNDVAVDQTNNTFQGPITGKYYNEYCLGTLTNE